MWKIHFGNIEKNENQNVNKMAKRKNTLLFFLNI